MIEIHSPAKINLYLKILGKRDDGYHEIESIFQEISLADKITIEDAKSLEVKTLNPFNIDIKQDSNIAFKAAKLFLETINENKRKFLISIDKKIPVGGGLGGGSSNATATLIGLNTIFNYPLSHAEIKDLSAQLGSDTIFFNYGGQCLCTGRGEIVKPIKCTTNYENVILLFPNEPVLTGNVFKNLKQNHYKIKSNSIFVNHLENSTFELYPAIKRAKENLKEILPNGETLMSGSGSTIFSLQNNLTSDQIDNLKKLFKNQIYFSQFSFKGCYVTHT